MLIGAATLASELDPPEVFDVAGRLRHPYLKYQSVPGWHRLCPLPL